MIIIGVSKPDWKKNLLLQGVHLYDNLILFCLSGAEYIDGTPLKCGWIKPSNSPSQDNSSKLAL